jgi:signal transduction histidine kinase
MGDPGRLKQVVLNLVQNAINAGATKIEILVVDSNRGVNLKVLDDGPGIPDNAIPHLFDRFYRVDGSRSGRGKGSGLGLAIVKWIVQQHNGEVAVESKVGEGTVFSVFIPSKLTLSSEVTLKETLTQTLNIFRSGRGESNKG